MWVEHTVIRKSLSVRVKPISNFTVQELCFFLISPSGGRSRAERKKGGFADCAGGSKHDKALDCEDFFGRCCWEIRCVAMTTGMEMRTGKVTYMEDDANDHLMGGSEIGNARI
jgi:hypothetical protein